MKTVSDLVYLSMMGDFEGRFLLRVGHPALLYSLVSCLDQLRRWYLPSGMVLAQSSILGCMQYFALT